MARKLKLHPQFSDQLNRWFSFAKRPLLEFAAGRHASFSPLRLRIAMVDRPAQSSDPETVVRLRKGRRGIDEIEVDPAAIATRRGFSTYWRRLGVFVDLLSRPIVPEGEWVADLADTTHQEGQVLGFCSNFRQTQLVPDRSFYYSDAYSRDRNRSLHAKDFDQRSDGIVWRGSPTGIGAVCSPTMDSSNEGLRQRVRMCLLLAKTQMSKSGEVDVRLVQNSEWDAETTQSYRHEGILGDYVSHESWADRKFAIDIDGFANAFSNLYVRMLYGCCVIKIASPFDFRQWYYERLQPWKHFIPVAADLSDLVETIEWCRSHSRKCREVAKAGQGVVQSMTRDGELSRVAHQLYLTANQGFDGANYRRAA